MQLLALWHEVFPSKPFNYADAVKLQIKLATQRVAHSRKEAEKRLKTQETNIKVVQSMCRHVAEKLLRVELSYDHMEISTRNGLIDWGEKIKDKLTHANLGTPRELLRDDGLTWESYGNPAENLEDFITRLKQYNEFQRSYSFNRPSDYNPIFPHMTLEKFPFEKKPPKFVKFILTLKWTPFSDKQLLKQAKKWLKEVSPRVQ